VGVKGSSYVMPYLPYSEEFYQFVRSGGAKAFAAIH